MIYINDYYHSYITAHMHIYYLIYNILDVYLSNKYTIGTKSIFNFMIICPCNLRVFCAFEVQNKKTSQLNLD